MSMVDPRSLKRILYIEDDADSRYLVRRLVADRYLLLEAGDALDLVTPQLDTYRLLEKNNQAAYEICKYFLCDSATLML